MVPSDLSVWAGGEGGRVLEGQAGLPAVGGPLPTRGGHSRAVRAGRPVRGPLWRVGVLSSLNRP